MRITILALALITACFADVDDWETSQTSQELVIDYIPQVYSQYYRIRERGASRSIDIASSNNAYGNYTYHGGINQQFLIIPTAPDSNQFYIASRKGGVIDAAGNNNLYMADAYPHGGFNQRFFIGHTFDSYYHRISTIHKYGAFDLAGGPSHKLYVGTPHTGQNQQFEFIPASSFPYAIPDRVDGAPPGMIGDVPRITSYSDSPPFSSTPVLIGTAPIPYIYVRGDGGRAYQVQYTPYYELTREQYWQRGPVFEKPVDGSATQQYTATYGMSQSQSIDLQNTFLFTIKLTGEASFSDQNVKASLGSALEQQIKVVTTFNSTVTYTQQFQETFNITLPVGKRVRWTAWHLVDSYTLRRMDKSYVNRWILSYRDTRIVDAYSN